MTEKLAILDCGGQYTKVIDRKIREAGVACTVYNGQQRKIGKELDYAGKAGFTHAVTMGGDEKAAGVVKVKNLSRREEKTVAVPDLADPKVFD